jgi:hypothetical protein
MLLRKRIVDFDPVFDGALPRLQNGGRTLLLAAATKSTASSNAIVRAMVPFVRLTPARSALPHPWEKKWISRQPIQWTAEPAFALLRWLDR